MSAYFIHTESEQKGPYTFEELKSADIHKDSLVWREGLADWIKAGDLPELNAFFIPIPPPFIQKEPKTIATQKMDIPPGKKRRGKNYILFGLPLLILLITGIIYFIFSKKINNDIGKTKEKFVVKTTDSLFKKDTAKSDTAKKIKSDTLSDWIVTDTIPNQKNSTENQSDFSIGGMPVRKKKDVSKKKLKTEATKQEEKRTEKKADVPNAEAPGPKRTSVKDLVIHGGYRKNLLFEAVLEGTIKNPNENISFSSISVTVQFLDSDGEELATKQFTQNGVVHGNQTVMFKFKTNAPKGAKSARFAVAGTGL